MSPPHHQEKKKILTARHKLGLLLHRCLTPAPATTDSPRQNLQGPQTYHRIQPLALPKGGNVATSRLLLQRVQEQAIQRWELPRRPEYGMLVKRTRTFHQAAARWNPEGKPSLESIAAAGFYYDAGFTIII